ncbi:MraY family glycosyltransferase [Streptomyces violascens]|uniref:MraY family glycosyltransferase n=1 Tax=Streptomyces violascens TaxID=67381 RepID=UPI0036954868
MLDQLAAATVALGLTVVLTGVVRLVAARFDVLDHPGGRKTHPLPTPNLGGVAVALATFGMTGAGALFGLAKLLDGMGPMLGASGAICLLGLVDDLWQLGPRTRLVVETAAALVVVSAAGLSLGTGLLAAVWIVFITNAFNLLDNSDGAMGTVAAVTSLGLVGCAIAEARPGFALLLTVLSAALTGFLLHNWHPAKIFLGDCGSLFTGFLLASSAVTVHADAPGPQFLAELLALTVVVVTDTLLVLVSRRRAGRSLLCGGTDHIAHRLRRIGLMPPHSAAVLGLTSLIGAVMALLIHDGRLPPAAVVPFALVVPITIVLLLRVPVYEPRSANQNTETATPFNTVAAADPGGEPG